MLLLQKTNALVSQTLFKLLSPNAKLLVLTSTSVPFEVLSRVYTLPQLGPLTVCQYAKVEHEGGRIQVSPFSLAGTSRQSGEAVRLIPGLTLSHASLIVPQNEFGMWGTWEGAEDFMKPAGEAGVNP